LFQPSEFPDIQIYTAQFTNLMPEFWSETASQMATNLVIEKAVTEVESINIPLIRK
jgi:hypothetical protein